MNPWTGGSRVAADVRRRNFRPAARVRSASLPRRLRTQGGAARAGRRAFTLIEIMIVVTIIGIIMSAGIPMMWRALKKDDLARAVNDILEGCKTARDLAILKGVSHEFVMQENGTLMVQAARGRSMEDAEAGAGSSGNVTRAAAEAGSMVSDFPRKLGENVIVRLIDVNFIDHMQEPEARVRFFPNGTSDEFTVVLFAGGAQRQITVDIVTGAAEEVIQ